MLSVSLAAKLREVLMYGGGSRPSQLINYSLKVVACYRDPQLRLILLLETEWGRSIETEIYYVQYVKGDVR